MCMLSYSISRLQSVAVHGISLLTSKFRFLGSALLFLFLCFTDWPLVHSGVMYRPLLGSVGFASCSVFVLSIPLYPP
jgi:hypothetical protein